MIKHSAAISRFLRDNPSLVGSVRKAAFLIIMGHFNKCERTVTALTEAGFLSTDFCWGMVEVGPHECNFIFVGKEEEVLEQLRRTPKPIPKKTPASTLIKMMAVRIKAIEDARLEYMKVNRTASQRAAAAVENPLTWQDVENRFPRQNWWFCVKPLRQALKFNGLR